MPPACVLNVLLCFVDEPGAWDSAQLRKAAQLQAGPMPWHVFPDLQMFFGKILVVEGTSQQLGSFCCVSGMVLPCRFQEWLRIMMMDSSKRVWSALMDMTCCRW